MAQYRFRQHRDELDSYQENQALLGVRRKGIITGFEIFNPSSALTFDLAHDDGGFILPIEGASNKDPVGAWVTNENTLIIEDSEILGFTVVANASGNPRIDAIYGQHSYSSVVGGAAATYGIITGTPAATPQIPSLSDASRVLLGYLYIADGVSNLSSGLANGDVRYYPCTAPPAGMEGSIPVGLPSKYIPSGFGFSFAGTRGDINRALHRSLPAFLDGGLWLNEKSDESLVIETTGDERSITVDPEYNIVEVSMQNGERIDTIKGLQRLGTFGNQSNRPTGKILIVRFIGSNKYTYMWLTHNSNEGSNDEKLLLMNSDMIVRSRDIAVFYVTGTQASNETRVRLIALLTGDRPGKGISLMFTGDRTAPQVLDSFGATAGGYEKLRTDPIAFSQDDSNSIYNFTATDYYGIDKVSADSFRLGKLYADSGGDYILAAKGKWRATVYLPIYISIGTATTVGTTGRSLFMWLVIRDKGTNETLWVSKEYYFVDVDCSEIGQLYTLISEVADFHYVPADVQANDAVIEFVIEYSHNFDNAPTALNAVPLSVLAGASYAADNKYEAAKLKLEYLGSTN